MRRIHKQLLAALAAVIAVGGGSLVVHDRMEEAERESRRESIRVAAEGIFQARADKKDAEWRRFAAPTGREWSHARAKVTLTDVEIQGARAKVRIQEITTPYTTDRSGADPRPDVPWAGQYVYVFEPAGDGWKFVKDISKEEFGS
ncbi:hypothetical protein ACPCSC_28950 [Streptomyces lavendulocolor]|uniref:hypothetical protein n=1 Tax=Streptomyces lavendulocolor TaxID=67316 RepID=UPI003C2C0764